MTITTDCSSSNAMHLLKRLVDGRIVAVVGNAESIMERQPPAGEEIDACDVVIRMNLGLPRYLLKSVPIGQRTDIWAIGRYWPSMVPQGCKLILWMKLTKLGKEELHALYASHPKCPIVEWPGGLELSCKNYVGAVPSTGIRLIWYLKHYTRAIVQTYGFDWWQTRTHWSKRRWTPHDPVKEREAFERMTAGE